jgi:hypothetical protein
VDISSLGEKVAGAGIPDPHEKVAEHVRKYTRRVIRFTPRTRAILVFIGAIAVIGSWFTPWYSCIGFVKSGAAFTVAYRYGYYVTNPANFGQSLLRQGYTAIEHDFSGRALASGPPQLRAIAFTQHDFEFWILLAILALLAMWTYERPDSPVVHRTRRQLHKWIESGKVIVLVYVLFRCVWKGIDLGTKSSVNAHALAALTSEFQASGVPPTAVTDYATTFSVGLILLLIGLICGALGVLSGDKPPKMVLGPDGYPVAAPRKVRVRAFTFGVGALILLVILYGCMGS